MEQMIERYLSIRNYTEQICAPLEIEDYVVQPTSEVSPPKWHLAHTTWFFETIILKEFYSSTYEVFNEKFDLLFNSYYKQLGAHWAQRDRGNLSRPTVKDIYRYRQHVDEAICKFLKSTSSKEVIKLIEIGLQHEQQHQELLYMDIKAILGGSIIETQYKEDLNISIHNSDNSWREFSSGIYEVGNSSDNFCYDNERPRHNVYLEDFKIQNSLISNQEYLNFIQDGGLENSKYWLAKGWDWIQSQEFKYPLYWRKKDSHYFEFKLNGLKELCLDSPVQHISYFEASAFAKWKGHRLPSEFELEVFLNSQAINDNYKLWCWSQSSYAPYPGFKEFDGHLNEYNGKFMCNQYVLRGGCYLSSENHLRSSYRNFYEPHQKWMFSGIRLAD